MCVLVYVCVLVFHIVCSVVKDMLRPFADSSHRVITVLVFIIGLHVNSVSCSYIFIQHYVAYSFAFMLPKLLKHC